MVEADPDWRTLLSAAHSWLAAGRAVAIATVASAWGSAPRRVGAQMVIDEQGAIAGSVSGGCVEGEVVAEALAILGSPAGPHGKTLDFDVADDVAWRVGLACGGRITVLLQAVRPGGFDPNLLARTLSATDTVLDLDEDGARLAAQDGAHAGTGLRLRYGPAPRLAIIGAAHIAQHLAPIMRILSYDVTVIDPRRQFATPERFPGATIDTRWPDEALDAWQPDAASAVVALTHDPKLDDPALMAALRSPAFYIAALGSRKTHAARLERLGAAGFAPQALARIHGPAGLSIGAATPAEIAVSVAAQLTAARRGVLA